MPKTKGALLALLLLFGGQLAQGQTQATTAAADESDAGKPRTLTSYLSLLKLGGEWKIVSFLISNGPGGGQ